jgi:pantoate--beta-alanine ligase
MTIIVNSIKEWLQIKNNLTNKKIGFVPTMGCLHDGHKSLLKKSKAENDISVLSIFVNPTQFNNDSDYILYPKSLEEDLLIAQEEKIDYIFVPDYNEIYNDKYTIRVREYTEIGQIMEGTYRPGHFDGMLTIVIKLLNIIAPNSAYFGEKDYQQLLLVKHLVKSFFLPVNIIGCPTVRLSNGLPMSSRNKRLSPAALEQAALFSQMLSSNLTNLEITTKLVDENIHIDYIHNIWDRRFGAITIENVRLIDNCELKK